MSTLFGPIVDLEASSHDKEFKPKLFINTRKFKSKENIFKPKLHRELKKKLKKYKLRRDGQEDPEVLDVSQILVTALKIKSPNNNLGNNGISNLEEELRPKNYLFKMGRKKQITKKKTREPSDVDAAVTNIIENNKDDVTPVKVKNEKVAKATNKHEMSHALETKLDKNGINSSKLSKDKKQTNAFALMMDSRNKSIGSNSPGKDRVVDELDLLNTVERKSIKAKRNLVLQKMAEAKGSLNNQEKEEYQEKCINHKMEKRAERLKNMIKGNESRSIGKDDKKLSSKKETTSTVLTNNNEDLPLLPHNNKLKLVNIFDERKHDQFSIKKKESVIEEDAEFLKKLSPSLKKKENMLCYFKKVEKEPDDIFASQDDDDTAIIKVKFKSKGKKAKKKLSLNKSILKEDLQCVIDHKNNMFDEDDEIMKADKKKRRNNIIKSNEKVDISKSDKLEESTELDLIRPKRNVKRPAKYFDDMQLSSSDEDLHIFTPKKKKHAESKVSIDETQPNKTKFYRGEKPSSQKENTKVNKEISQTKKQTKLAPIFASKPQLDAAAIEAKQKFLSSGVPDKLKKTIEKQTHKSVGVNNFHTVVHVQQKQDASHEGSEIVNDILYQSDTEEKLDEIVCEKDLFKNILMLKQNPKMGEPNLKTKAQTLLQNMKQLYPKFPVYRTYRSLRDKKRGEFKDCSYLDLDNSIEVINGLIDITNESPDKLSWTDKYKAMSSKQIIGNFKCIKELRKWLVSWTEYDVKLKKNNYTGSDSSDFYISDADSKDSMKCANNLLVLTGPVGSGKTSLVYAVAAELAIKVLEVNASSKRTGKIMLQDLQEATQSHKVNRGKNSQENSQSSQETNHCEKSKVNKKRGRPKKQVEVVSKKSELKPKTEVQSQSSSSQDSVRTCMSLILIDDADIVFDQDDGFCSAIVQLVQCSKRPVILITSSTSCLHLQRFLQCAKIIQTCPLLPRMLGTWLDIMCLADSGTCWPGLGALCLDYFNGDIRRTINFLHFQTARVSAIDDEGTPQNFDDYKASIEDENSNMSWSDREGMDEKNENVNPDLTADTNMLQYFMNKQLNWLSFKYPFNSFIVWWNIPRLLITPIKDKNKKCSKGMKIKSKKSDLDVISNVANMISIADSYYHIENNMESELVNFPWVNLESHSVSEQENLDKYDRNCEIMHEITHSLLSRSILEAQNDLGLDPGSDLLFPGMVLKRERNRVTSRHNHLSSFLNPSAVLDRRSLALDYWSGCRTICRIEKTKTDSNSKRNNRFCHYLKSVNILCKSDSFDNLGNSLYSKVGNELS